MLDWDDIKYFLAVAQSPTVRAAAERLSVNHSTVLRRISLLEGRLGAQLFDKLPSGYRLTAAGSEVLEAAEDMELSSLRFESRIVGRDQQLGGVLRIAVPPTLATYLLAPDFAQFARLHPDVEIDIIASNEVVNLTNRDADVAIRVVYDRRALPPNLHGSPGPELGGGVYIAPELLAAVSERRLAAARWIVRDDLGIPDWANDHGLPTSGPPFRTNNAESQIAAVRDGLGLTTLSCFVGDADLRLVRVPGAPLHLHGCIWVLTQGEARKTKRVRLFTKFINERLVSHADLLAGRKPREAA